MNNPSAILILANGKPSAETPLANKKATVETQGHSLLRVGAECENERDKGELHFPIFDESSGCVAHVKKESDAKRIVQCVNAFDDLLAALKPFAEAAKELTRIGGIATKDQYLWKPSSNTREMEGISAQHIINALAAVEKAEARP